MQIQISGGRTIDPGQFDGIADIIINDGKIAALIESKQTGRQAKRQTFNSKEPEYLTHRARSSPRFNRYAYSFA
jgi:hypothetical protein